MPNLWGIMKSVSTNYGDFDKLGWAEVRSEPLDLRGSDYWAGWADVSNGLDEEYDDAN